MKPDRSDNLEEQLSAYLDGEVTDAERAEVEAYLAASEEARRLLADLKRNAEWLRSLPRAKAPDGLPELVASELERRELLGEEPTAGFARRPAGRRLGRWLASAAVIALAASAGILTFTHLRQGAPRSASGPFGPLADIRDRSPKVPQEARREETAAAPREPRTEMKRKTGGPAAPEAASPQSLVAVTGGAGKAMTHGWATVGQSSGAGKEGGASSPSPVDGAAAALSAESGRPEASMRLSKNASVATPGTVAPGQGGRGTIGPGGTLGRVTQQTIAAAPESTPAGRNAGDENASFEIKLVYADEAAKKAAVGLIGQSLRRSQVTQDAVPARTFASQPTSPVEEAGHFGASLTYTIAPSEPDAQGSVIVVDAPAETAPAIIRAVEEAGTRIAPISVSAQRRAASGWPAVQSLGREYAAAHAASPNGDTENGVLSVTSFAGDVAANITPSGATPAHSDDHAATSGVGVGTAPASSTSLREVNTKSAARPPSLAPCDYAAASVPAPATGLVAQSRRLQPVAAARPNVPLELAPAERPASLPTKRQMRGRADGAASRPAGSGGRVQILIHLLAAPDAARAKAPTSATTRPAASMPAQDVRP